MYSEYVLPVVRISLIVDVVVVGGNQKLPTQLIFQSLYGYIAKTHVQRDTTYFLPVLRTMSIAVHELTTG